MSTGIFSVGITGMNAAQIGLLTTEHNITNATTAGYNRQRIGQNAAIALQTGAGFVGQGVNVTTVARVYNDFLQKQITQASTVVSELDTYYSQIKQVDNLVADVNAGLSPALQDFFKGVQQLAGSPASITARQAFVSSAQSLVSRFQSLDARLSEMYTGVNEQLASTVTLINSYGEQIARLNERIAVSQAASGQPPNDLLDERDQVVAELNKQIRVTTALEGDGSLSIFIGSGQQLVVGQRASSLDVRPSYADPERFTVGLVNGTAYQELPETMLSGGNLSGFLRFRNESLDKAVNTLGNVAASLASVFNAQQGLGQDLLGQTTGTPGFAEKLFLFESTNVPKIIGHALNRGTATVSAASVTELSGTRGFDAPGVANGNFSTELTGSDYEIRFDGAGGYTIKRLSDKATITPTANADGSVSFDGLRLNIDAAGGVEGDRFLLEPTREISRNFRLNSQVTGDPRLVAAASPVRSDTGINTITGLPNSGNALVSAPTVTQGFDLTVLPVTYTYDAGANTINGDPYDPAGTTFTVGGVSFTITGRPNDGDTFLVGANTNGVSNSSNAVLMGKLQTQNTMLANPGSGGNASFQGVYAQMVSAIGNTTREVEVTAEAQRTLLEQAEATRNAQSGVNLDEEAANLLRFQYAYQASAKMLEVGTRLFDTVLSIGR